MTAQNFLFSSSPFVICEKDEEVVYNSRFANSTKNKMYKL
jgi:hypothetical protein